MRPVSRFPACCAVVFAVAIHAPAIHGDVAAQVDVFVGGAEGPLGTSNYRIPGFSVATDGSLLAFAEGRRSGSDPGQGGFPIDLVMKRSVDGGLTWSPLVVLESDPAFDYDDPTPVVDASTGNVHLLYGRVPDACGLFCVPPGTGANSMNTFQRTSVDHGQTWSSPVNITAQIKDPSWQGIVPGPGSGIQLEWQDSAPQRNGRLIVPGSINANRNLLFYSDDGGANWQSSDLAQDDLGLGGGFNGNENEVVELTNGDLLMNARQSGGASRRMFRSVDGGSTWVESYNGPSPVTRVDASMIRYSAVRSGDDRDRLLFSAPSGSPAGSGGGRSNMAVWTSYDEGRSFTNPVQVDDGFGAYSVLGKLQDGSIGLVFEATGSTLIQYVNFDTTHLEGAVHPAAMSHYDGFGNRIDPFQGGVGWSGSWNDSGAVVESNPLEFSGFFTAGDENHIRLRGAEVQRNLGLGAIDLNRNQDYFVSVFVQHDSDDGSDSGSEFLDILFQDGQGATQAAFGVGSAEHFFVNELGATVGSGSDAAVRDTTYLLLAKIEAQDDSNGANFDQLHLAWYDDPAQVPAAEGDVVWQLASGASENNDSVLESIQIGAGSSADWLVDGLRIGTDFEAVIVDTGVGHPPVLGDLNGDLRIDLLDWVELRGNITRDTTGLSEQGKLDVGDFDLNGIVGPSDFTTFAELFDVANGVGAFSAAASEVPEPSAALLAIFGAIGIQFNQRGRRRRSDFGLPRRCAGPVQRWRRCLDD